MTARTPACEDAAAITARLREIQRDRMAAIAGCTCGRLGPAQHDVAGNLVHSPQCPLRQGPGAAALVEAMQRARARVHRAAPGTPPLTADEIVAEGIREKAARHRVLT